MKNALPRISYLQPLGSSSAWSSVIKSTCWSRNEGRKKLFMFTPRRVQDTKKGSCKMDESQCSQICETQIGPNWM